DRLAAAVPEGGFAAGGSHVLDPFRVGAEHGHQVPLTLDGLQHHGCGADLSGLPAPDLERLLEPRRKSLGRPPLRQPIGDLTEPRRPPIPVEEPDYAPFGGVAPAFGHRLTSITAPSA